MTDTGAGKRRGCECLGSCDHVCTRWCEVCRDRREARYHRVMAELMSRRVRPSGYVG